ncbi:MAG: hypothetical protein HKK67_04345 [Chlorobiaceae bacterium]|nr:hypothetical protein [Chlorobiaceae bacterium]
MRALLIVFIALAIIFASLAAVFPEVLLNPGALMQGHHSFEKECLSCHKPFAGATTVQCISCHKQRDISVRNVAGAWLPKNTTKALFHRAVSANSCLSCHTDHRGRAAAKALKPFMHEALSPVQQKECLICHLNKKPQDLLHRYAQGNCSECHGKKQWNPATFDHDRYFRLDSNHSVSCITCHTEPGNYRKYTCCNCHEHSPARIAWKHEKEGILNYQNCMKCHRDGSLEGGD